MVGGSNRRVSPASEENSLARARGTVWTNIRVTRKARRQKTASMVYMHVYTQGRRVPPAFIAEASGSTPKGRVLQMSTPRHDVCRQIKGVIEPKNVSIQLVAKAVTAAIPRHTCLVCSQTMANREQQARERVATLPT